MVSRQNSENKITYKKPQIINGDFYNMDNGIPIQQIMFLWINRK